MRKILALESSTTWASVAIIENNNVRAERSSGHLRSHSEFINSAIQELFESTKTNIQELDLLAVGCGPGSFTGIRVAINTAKTFSYLRNLPIYTCDSLAILREATGKDCFTMINAFKNMIYYSAFLNGNQFSSPDVVSINKLDETLSALGVNTSLLAIGDGFNAYETVLSEKTKLLLDRSPNFGDYPKASTLGLMAASNKAVGKIFSWNQILPLYIRASEAEENFRKNS